MKTVACIFGGKSCERDVSVLTALEVMPLLEGNYNVVPIYMREDKWYVGKRLKKVEFYKKFKDSSLKSVWLKGKTLYSKGVLGIKRVCDIDVALVCAHGGDGENGNLQALLEINGVPYTSAEPLSARLCMNKIQFKKYLKSGIAKTLKCVEYLGDRDKWIDEVEAIGYPVVVKPASLGSSIGITVARDREALAEGLDLALLYDNEVLAEKYIANMTEYNCAIYRSGDTLVPSRVESPIKSGDILSFGDKYTLDKTLAKDEGAEISPKIATKVQNTTCKIYKYMGLGGMVRMDYIYDNDTSKLYINEVNTIPGSMSLYLYDKDDWYTILNTLIKEGEERAKRRQSLKHYFPCDIFNTQGCKSIKK